MHHILTSFIISLAVLAQLGEAAVGSACTPIDGIAAQAPGAMDPFPSKTPESISSSINMFRYACGYAESTGSSVALAVSVNHLQAKVRRPAFLPMLQCRVQT